MYEFFGLTKDEFFDNTKVKILDGIAGSAKSSHVDYIFKRLGISYGRFTSTNKLMNDSIRRYGGYCNTITSGLFVNSRGRYCVEEKDVEFDNVVLEEVLQCSAKVFDWVRHHVGKVNIIICTDSRQQVAPDVHCDILKAFNELKSEPFAIVRETRKSFRPVDRETSFIYDELYSSVDSPVCVFDRLRENFETVKLSSISYDPSAVYLCHTKDIEEMLYSKFRLYDRYDLKLLPKGLLSKEKPVNIKKYPILPQNKVSNSERYFQIENIATVSRYQGSEVDVGNICYYIVEKSSLVSNREFYTAFSRVKSWRSFKIVVCEVQKSESISGFGDMKAKLSDEPRRGGKFAQENDKNSKCIWLDVINKHIFYCSKASNIFRRFEMAERRFNDSLEYPYLHGPMFLNHDKSRQEYSYGLDLKSAYPHALCFGKMPIDGEWIDGPDDGLEYFEEPQDGYLDLYAVKDASLTTDRSICSGDLVRFIRDNAPATRGVYYYLGKISCVTGCSLGVEYHEMAHRSVESNEKLKTLKWGWLEKPMMVVEDKENVVVYPNRGYFLLMCAIKSEVALAMAKAKKVIYGDLTKGFVRVDCLYFDFDGDIEELGDRLSIALGNFDFRIFKNEGAAKTNDNPVLYKTYEDLKTEAELKAEAHRERTRRYRERKQAAKENLTK